MTEINISVTWLENKVEEHIPNSKTKKVEKENGRPNIGNLENQYKKSKHLIGRYFREREQRVQWVIEERTDRFSQMLKKHC